MHAFEAMSRRYPVIGHRERRGKGSPASERAAEPDVAVVAAAYLLRPGDIQFAVSPECDLRPVLAIDIERFRGVVDPDGGFEAAADVLGTGHVDVLCLRERHP